jgi:hypothetical protein
MKQPLLGLLLACALTAPCWAEEAEKPTIVPVTNAAFHSVVFENDNMSLVSVTLPPGTSTGYHSHDQDLVFAITAGAKSRAVLRYGTGHANISVLIVNIPSGGFV